MNAHHHPAKMGRPVKIWSMAMCATAVLSGLKNTAPCVRLNSTYVFICKTNKKKSIAYLKRYILSGVDEMMFSISLVISTTITKGNAVAGQNKTLQKQHK